MSRASERHDSFGPHPAIGRRYEHADLTTHRVRNRRARRLTLLVERAVRTVMQRYARELEVPPEATENFAREVAHRLRADVYLDWTPEQAESRAHAIAEQLFAELDDADPDPE
jgi:hypothetical protein